MIASIQGTIQRKTPESVVIGTNGIGYEIFISLNTYYKLPDAGNDVFLITHTHVREDVLQLFGFLDEHEKRLFHMLMGVAKIGPRLALNILSGITPVELKDAIIRGDQYRISQIPRVGKKTAERIIVELRDKMKTVVVQAGDLRHVPDGARKAVDDVMEALLVLGYSRKEAEKGIHQALSKAPEGFTVEILLKESLRMLTTG